MPSNNTDRGRMEKTILGYVPKKSIVYILHPSVRLAIFLVTGIFPVFIQRPEITFCFLMLEFLMFPIANIKISRLKVFTPMFISVFIFIMVVHWFAPIHKEKDIVLFTYFGKPAYFYSISWGLSIYFKIICLVVASIFYFSTNRERDFLVSLRVFGCPFAVSYFCGLAMRSAGIFMEDYSIIREAERARGLDTRKMNFAGKVKHFSMYLIPLFTLSIRRSEEISMALYAKGLEYSGKVNGVKRAYYLRSKMKLTIFDKILMITIFIPFFIGLATILTTNVFALERSMVYNHILSQISR
jgi:energy-coupling factor transporter transmembrane protein EcfT